MKRMELFVAAKKVCVVVISEGPQTYERPFVTGGFQVSAHDVGPTMDEPAPIAHAVARQVGASLPQF